MPFSISVSVGFYGAPQLHSATAARSPEFDGCLGPYPFPYLNHTLDITSGTILTQGPFLLISGALPRRPF